MDQGRRDALLEEYREAVGNFRLLTEIRFKLLALLPIATAVAAALREDDPTDVAGALESLALFGFGLVVTLGLLTYNARNDQLYDSLVGRAAAIERSLGLPDGAFANRPYGWLKFGRGWAEWPVGHRNSVALIYGASIALWLFGCLAALGLIVWELLPASEDGSKAPAWINAAAFILAVAVTGGGALRLKGLREAKEKRLRAQARQAVTEATGLALARLGREARFLDACTALAQTKRERVEKRAEFLAKLDRKSYGYYLPRTSDPVVAASALVALVTDLPPEWIFDCATERRRPVLPRAAPGSDRTPG